MIRNKRPRDFAFEDEGDIDIDDDHEVVKTELKVLQLRTPAADSLQSPETPVLALRR